MAFPMPTMNLIEEAIFSGGNPVALIESLASDTKTLLDVLAEAEKNLKKTHFTMTRAMDRGLLTQKDIDQYDALRYSIAASQWDLLYQIRSTFIVRVSAMVAADVDLLNMLPEPRMAPRLGDPWPEENIAGLGAAAAIPAVILWAAAIIAILVTITVIAIVVSNVDAAHETVRNIAISWINGKNLNAFWEQRIDAYEECIKHNSTPEICARVAAETIPTPKVAAQPPPPPSGPRWWLWMLGGVGVLTATGVLVWVWRRRGGSLLPATSGLGQLGYAKATHMRGPKKLDRYYEPCMKRHDDKAYCSRVAWSIYCKSNPSYKGCTKYGRTKATKYPLSRRS